MGWITDVPLVTFLQAGVGAIARTVRDKLRASISVDDFIPQSANATQTRLGIQAAIDYVKTIGGGKVKFTGGKIYYIDGPINIVGDATYWNVRFGIEIEVGAVVRAISTMVGQPMFVLTADSAGHMVGFEIKGKGEIDCANYATKGIWVKTGARGYIRDLKITNPTLMGVHVGDPASPAGGSEVHCWNVQPWRDEGANNDPNSIGIFYEVITDCELWQCHPVGFRIGIKTITNVRMFGCHPWAKIGHGPMRYAFWVEGGDSNLYGCYADTPHSHNFDGTVDPSIPDVYGFFINGYGISLYAPVTYLNQAHAVDNVATGVWINHNDGLFGVISGDRYDGGTTAKFKRYIGQLGQTTRLVGVSRIGGYAGGAFAYDTNNMADFSGTTLILNGGVETGDGAVGQPRHTFSAEETSGLYRAAAGDVRMTVLGQDVAGFTANTLTQRSGTNAQTHLLYNTYTDASNYERGFFRWSGNVLQIGTENAGTGQTREVRLYTNGQQRWGVSGSGAFYPITNAAIDIGFSSNAVRHLYQSGVGVNSSTNVATPTTGQTVTVAQTTNLQVCDPAGALAALTVQFPTPLADGHAFGLAISQAITALTLTPNSGASIKGGVTSTSGYAALRFRYNAANTTWYQAS